MKNARGFYPVVAIPPGTMAPDNKSMASSSPSRRQGAAPSGGGRKDKKPKREKSKEQKAKCKQCNHIQSKVSTLCGQYPFDSKVHPQSNTKHKLI